MTAPHQNLLGMSGGVAEEETDPNFNQTVLLLHGDGTNGGQNNTFVDSSSSGHTITRSGNATQGTFNPFLGEGLELLWSACLVPLLQKLGNRTNEGTSTGRRECTIH